MTRLRAFVIVVLLLTLIAAVPTLLTVPIPEDSREVLVALLGWFMAKGSDAIGYLLNSTEGSKAKNEATAAALSTATQALADRSASDAASPLKTDNVSVEADTATVTTSDKRDSLREKFT